MLNLDGLEATRQEANIFPIEEKEATPENIQQEKELALSILKALSQIEPNVILAGGAPRNWDFGRLANDFDFYIAGSHRFKSPEALDKLLRLYVDVESKDVSVGGVYDGDEPCFSQTVNFQIEGKDCQLMVLQPAQLTEALVVGVEDVYARTDPKLFIQHCFDIGLCQICLDPEGLITKYDAYLNDKQFKRLTVCLTQMTEYNPGGIKRISPHWKKLQRMFPDFETVIE